MKITDLFRKKLDILFGRSEPSEKEFLKKNIYKNIDPTSGLTIKQMKLLIPEILAHKIRIVGIETIDKKTSEFDAYTWESFESQYVNDWIVKAVKAIEEKGSNPKCFVYVDFPIN